jgi:hypothetical protein
MSQQLYLAIGIPILANFAMMLLGFTLLSNHVSAMNTALTKRLDGLRSAVADFRDDVKLLTGKVYEMRNGHNESPL